jgi:hypothetical protein
MAVVTTAGGPVTVVVMAVGAAGAAGLAGAAQGQVGTGSAALPAAVPCPKRQRGTPQPQPQLRR